MLEDVPITQFMSNVAESVSTKMNLDCQWQANATSTCGLSVTESKRNTTEICEINQLNPAEIEYVQYTTLESVLFFLNNMKE